MVYDKNMNILENPDMTKGSTRVESMKVHHEWDNATRSWRTTDGNGNPVDYTGDIPEGMQGESFWEDWSFLVYVPFTPEEQAEYDKEAKREAFYKEAPERVEALESGVDDSYEAIADLGVDVADHAVALDDIMEAIAELGVTIEELNNG